MSDSESLTTKFYIERQSMNILYLSLNDIFVKTFIPQYLQ